nr:MAG TPA: hypothetical protein [Caudoviricetes sp.]
MVDRRSNRSATRTSGTLTVRNNNGAGTGYSTSSRLQANAARAQRLRRIGNRYAPGGTRVWNGWS